MYLFLYSGYSKKEGPSTDQLVMKALDIFLEETGLDPEGFSREICRTDRGKPYFQQLPVAFSVSHTDDVWVCFMKKGTDPVGVDVQVTKDYSLDKIADRYYTDAEKQMVKMEGPEGFFRIWTRKEAYGKLTGKGLSENLSAIDVLNNNQVLFEDFHIREGLTGACCFTDKEDLWIRRI